MLKAKAKRAVAWSGLDIFLRQGIGFVISIVLARLLGPEEFGLIALLSFFMGIAWVFVDSGFSAALIQKQDASPEDESTIFWFNIVTGMLMFLLLYSLAPWIAGFYELPVLLPLTMAMSFNVLFSAASSVQNALLAKRLDFKTPMKISVVSTVLSGGVGLYMAWKGLGVWALVAQSLLSNLVSMVMLWSLSSWRPTMVFSLVSFRCLSRVGGYLFASRILDVMYRRGYALVIGKYFGLSELGFYNRADSTVKLPNSMISNIVSRVAFPLFSKVNHNADKLRMGAQGAIRSIMLITAPVMFGLAALAEPFMEVVFGDKWLPAAPVMRILCFAGLFLPLHIINLNVMKAKGHAKLFFRLEVIKKTIGVTLIYLGSFYGIMGIAVSVSIQSFIELIINAGYTGKHINYGLREQIGDCLPTIILSGMMAVIVFWLNALFQYEGVLNLIALVTLGAMIYLASNLLLGVVAFKEAIGFIRSRSS